MCTHCLALRPEQLAFDPLPPPILLSPLSSVVTPPPPIGAPHLEITPSPLALYLTEVYKMPTFIQLDRSFSEGKVKGGYSVAAL